MFQRSGYAAARDLQYRRTLAVAGSGGRESHPRTAADGGPSRPQSRHVLVHRVQEVVGEIGLQQLLNPSHRFFARPTPGVADRVDGGRDRGRLVVEIETASVRVRRLDLPQFLDAVGVFRVAVRTDHDHGPAAAERNGCLLVAGQHGDRLLARVALVRQVPLPRSQAGRAAGRAERELPERERAVGPQPAPIRWKTTTRSHRSTWRSGS